MVHKKYSYKNGKKYGPYFYENTRVGEKVVTRYIGKEEERRISFVNIGLIVLIVVFCFGLFYFFSLNMTGYPILGLTSFVSPNGTCTNCSLNGSIEISNVHSNNTDASLVSYWQFTNGPRDNKGIFNFSVSGEGAIREHERYYFGGSSYLHASCNFNCLGTPSNPSCSQFGDAASCDAYSSHGGECSSIYSCVGTPNTDCGVYNDIQCGENSGGYDLGHYNGCSYVGVNTCSGSYNCSNMNTNYCAVVAGCSLSWSDLGQGYAWNCVGVPDNPSCGFFSSGDQCNYYPATSNGNPCTWHSMNYYCAGTAGTPSCSVFTNADSCGRENGCSWTWGSCSCATLEGMGDCTGTLTCAGQTTQSACDNLNSAGGCIWTSDGYGGGSCSGTPYVGDSCSSWNSNQLYCEAESGHSGECTYHYSNYRCQPGAGLTCPSQSQSLGCSSLSGCSVNVTGGFPFVGDINWSVFSWVKTSATGGNIFSMGDNGLAFLRLAITGSGRLETNANNPSPQLINNSYPVNDDRWHHVGLTYNGTHLSLFVDGNLSSNALTDPIELPCSTGFTAAYKPGSGSNLVGRMDEIKVYNRSLNSSDAQGIYNAGLFQRSANYTSVFYDLGEPKNFKNVTWNASNIETIDTNSSLVLRLTMDSVNSSGDFVDSGVYSYNATRYGNVTQNDSGKIGKSASFDGEGDYLDVGNFNYTGTSPFTISAWVKTTENPTGAADWIVGHNSGATTQYNVGMYGGGVLGLEANNAYLGSGTISFNDGNWHHVLTVFGGNRVLGYIDGVLDLNLSRPSLPSVAFSTTIGLSDTNQYWNGSIDEVLIYNKSLNFYEISQLYENSSKASNYENMSDIQLQFRVASDSNSSPTYTAWTSLLTNSSYSPLSLTSESNLYRYIQFRAFFNSNYTFISPALNSLNIYYNNNDTVAPLVTIVSPLNSSYLLPIIFNVSLNEPGHVRFSLNNGSTNRTMSSLNNLSFNYTNSTLVPGSYTFIIYANDTSANRNYTESVNFTVSSTPPTINFTSPTTASGTEITNNFILSLIEANSIYYKNYSYYLYNSTGLVSNNGFYSERLGVLTGGYHTCALLNTGNITCWGLNTNGQSANYTQGNAIGFSTFDDNTCALLNTGNITCWGASSHNQSNNYTQGNAIGFSAGDVHTCALLNNGNITCWGRNDSGESNNYTQGNAIGVSAGGGHTCALLNTGNITCFGLNNFNQSNNYTQGNAIGVSAGNVHTCALLNNSNVSCWGSNTNGQSANYTQGNAIGVSAAISHTCALLNSGNITCWGSNTNGQSANYTKGNAIGVSAGNAHTCALLNSGNITCWGLNANGQSANYTKGNAKKQSLYAFLGLANGTYYLNASACDTYNSCNWTETRTIVIGPSAPLVTIVSPSGTYTSDSYNINITLNEAGYCEYSLNSGSSNLTLTAGNSNKEFTGTKSGVSNGDYTLRAYCNDSAGNKNYTTSKAFSVSVGSSVINNGGGGGGGGGGGLPVVGTPIVAEATYSASEEQIKVGYRQALSEKESIKFFVNTQEHLVVLDKLIDDRISITVSSVPQIMNISLGKQVEVDVDEDNIKDVSIGFWSIKDGKAEIFIKLASASQNVNQTKGVNASKGGANILSNFNLSDYFDIKWVVGLIVAILLVSFAIYRVVRRKVLERRWEKSRQQFKWRPVGEFKEETKKVD